MTILGVDLFIFVPGAVKDPVDESGNPVRAILPVICRKSLLSTLSSFPYIHASQIYVPILFMIQADTVEFIETMKI